MRQLSDNQRKAIEHIEGPILVLAGAGSGKTFVLISRIINLIQHGVKPSEILAVTFTNKAANEMKSRIRMQTNQRVWVGTFHSFGVSVLREYGEYAGLSSSYVIYDDADQKTLMKEVLKRVEGPWEDKKPDYFINYISRLKDNLIDDESYLPDESSPIEKHMASVYRLYQDALKLNNAVDFGDLILKSVCLLRENESVLEVYQNRYKYILIDEYQDTNKSQHELVSMLSKKHKNICIVGDPDQSIYSWRGAHINNILSFPKQWDECQVVTLEENFRSTSHILDAANEVIVKNSERMSKTLKSVKGEGKKIKIYEAMDQDDEAEFVCRTIERIKKEGGSYSQCGILYRVNSLSRSFEKLLAMRSIPYKVIGGMKFYHRKEIKDVLSYLRLIVNPLDEIAFMRVLQSPKRGLGAKRLNKLVDFAHQHCSGNLLHALMDIDLCSELPSTVKGPIAQWGDMWREALESLDNGESFVTVLEKVLRESGYVDFLKKEENAQSRLENIDALLSDMVNFVEYSERLGAQDYLQAVSLVTELTGEDEENKEDVVTLMSIHSAKGLEFDTCFVVGLEKGIFPSSRSLEDPFQMEEERRLCYVALTRAETDLYLTYCARRLLYGSWVQQEASLFIGDIPDKHIAVSVKQKNTHQGSSYQVLNKGQEKGRLKYLDKNDEEFEQRRKKEEGQVFNVGNKLLHPCWGKGIVLSVEGEGDNQKVDVFFSSLGKRKKLLASVAQLKKIG